MPSQRDYFRVAGAGFKRKHDTLDQYSNVSSEKPSWPYDAVSSLADLKKGPNRVAFDARIVNIYDQPNAYFDDGAENINRSSKKKTKKPSKKDNDEGVCQQARGCLKLILRDDTGYILVKLWYADITYDLRLGKLVSIWATHISPFKPQLKGPGKVDSTSTPSKPLTPPSTPPKDFPLSLMTSIFPEKDQGCGIKIHERGDIGIIGRIPMGYKYPFPVDSLVDAPKKHSMGKSTKVLVYVYAIGPVRERLTDGHSRASLGLYGEAIKSSMKWIPNSTVLMISNASWKPGSRLYLTSFTLVDVDPESIEADELKRLAARRAGQVNPPFPTDLFDVEEFESSIQKIKFTFADVDEFANSTRSEFMGYASVVLLDINLAALYKQNSLFCAECCNVPVFSNSTVAFCGQCELEVKLRLNPQVFPDWLNHRRNRDDIMLPSYVQLCNWL
ncbi:hypothetical protein MGYG_04944 [Nannizzia gypsea CBS 118893]|uniref:Uncharacterized protein n=1 Tax=Arthroderma gypseum (strain ATCC MYA-4604 / CBS 118893) TaxID=535722 RepID=E4UXP8_ARTGP|nr:hypothetical protein MGYG_04944 [Nannizzia gypsea CBS 118893]EFR01943.1 hypothetical protein MGYG_04944 [Nannizzia gypsea CBS 118893]